MSMDLKKMGESIQKLRIEQGYSIEEFARIVMLPEETLSAVEKGNIRPDDLSLLLIGNVLNVYPDQLLEGKVIPKRADSELIQMSKEILRYLDDIKSDNEYFKRFLENFGYGEPDIDIEQGKETVDYSRRIIQKYEQSIGRSREESVLNTYSAEQILMYAEAYQDYLRFGQEVDSCLAGTLNKRNAVFVCSTPDVFQENTPCRDLPMLITQSHLRNSMKDKVSTNRHYHGLSLEEIRRIPETLHDPAVIMQSSTREDVLVAVLGYRDRDGHAVVAAIIPEGKGTYDLKQQPSNFILSVYGKEDVNTLIQHMYEEDKIYYINENRSRELALPQLPLRRGNLVPASEKSIDQTTGKVNFHGLAEKKKEEMKTSVPKFGTTIKSRIK